MRPQKIRTVRRKTVPSPDKDDTLTASLSCELPRPDGRTTQGVQDEVGRRAARSSRGESGLGKVGRRDPYMIKSVVHAANLLATFGSKGAVLSLRDLTSRSKLTRGIVFRLLYTLNRCGFVAKVGANQYRVLVSHPHEPKLRLGYASLGDDPFVREVTNGLRFAAERFGDVDLLRMDNRLSRTRTIRNADYMVRERVGVAIEYLRDAQIAPIVAAKFHAAGIPVITINNPLPGAIYLGVNSYEAGYAGGHFLGNWALHNWDGQVEEVVLMDIRQVSEVVRSRVSGALDGITKVLGEHRTARAKIVRLDGGGDFEKSWRLTRAHLLSVKAKRTLVCGINDTTVLGALRAYEEAGRVSHCAAMGQNCNPEARKELRRPGSRFLGSVAYFPEQYGEVLLRVALQLSQGLFVPPAVFVEHRLLTRGNVDAVYPFDQENEPPQRGLSE